MRTLKLTLAYDGGAYAGWQSQAGPPSLQGALEAVLLRITGETIRVVASGRTDAGVHALGQVVSFSTNSDLAPERFARALNAWLPRDMAALSVEEAAPSFDARRDAVRKRYRYMIDDGPFADVFRRWHAWHYRQRLDVDAMRRSARSLIGRHDFSSYETGGSPRSSSVRSVYALDVERRAAPDANLIWIEIEADGFLYNMVRTIVGTLVEVGRGARDEAWPGAALAARNRRATGMTAPPHGLFLVRVEYSRGKDEG